MNYTLEQLTNIIVYQLTDKERSGILCYLVGWFQSETNPELQEVLNKAIPLCVTSKIKIEEAK